MNSLGISGVSSVAGTGTQYAVALAAGAAGLARTAYPEPTPEQIVHRIQMTSDKLSDSQPSDGRFGYGMINLAAAVTKVLPEEAGGGTGNGDKQHLAQGVPSNRSAVPSA
ncbi:S8 family serine peptidase [Actinoplanes sp. NPDC089786]|uniref:S8 family serine peptidase n=1 Tax=Actinoplanes sp. NPDC089786 TaxID=3155185 RepID=UPI0034380118